MPVLRDVIAGPWRAVLVLGVTQILAWGAIFYPPVLTVPLIADARGWSMSFAMGGFSLALLTAGLVSPRIGWLIDRHGGHRVMPIGSLLAALGLALLVYAAHPASTIPPLPRWAASSALRLDARSPCSRLPADLPRPSAGR
jgi:MFS family permease